MSKRDKGPDIKMKNKQSISNNNKKTLPIRNKQVTSPPLEAFYFLIIYKDFLTKENFGFNKTNEPHLLR